MSKTLEERARETFRATENVTKSIEQRVNLIESPQILEQFVVSYMRDFAAPYEAALRELVEAGAAMPQVFTDLEADVNAFASAHGTTYNSWPMADEVIERYKQALAKAEAVLDLGEQDDDQD